MPANLVRRALVALCLLAAPAASAADWPQYQHDAAHTGYTPSSLDPRRLAYAWTSPQGYAAPLIQGDTVYAYSRSAITAFDLASGRERWSAPVTEAGPIALLGDVVVTTSYPFATPKSLQVLDAATGALRYAVPSGG
jgi:outer membrane protein assembly factor BamB